MADDTFIDSLPLSSLPYKTRKLLSCMLNSPKIIPSDGPDKLPRDWRGLAYRANISSELESYIQQCSDKTAKVLEIWQQNSRTATVGELLHHLELIDRFDVYDDVCNDLREAIRSGELSARKPNQIALPNNVNSLSIYDRYDSEQITYDDRPGYAHMYDAMVLYADEDKEFVDDMLRRMGEGGYQICTIDDLHVGHSTQYEPVARLISNRCRRVILVFSPEFLNSEAMKFYINFAQADSIESRDRKIIPIMYRSCQLPSNLSYYHKLFYQSNGRSMYDFWDKLKLSLEAARTVHSSAQHRQRVNGSHTQAPPQIRIDEFTSDPLPEYDDDDSLFLPRTHGASISMNSLDNLKISSLTTDDRKSLSNVSQGSAVSEKKKKKNPFKKIFSLKKKKTIMVAD